MFDTREAWLTAATDGLKPWLAEAGSPVQVPVRAAIGFPSRGALSAKRRRIGECWAVTASTDGTAEILVSPLLDDPLEVLATLLHELGHAALGPKAGHRQKFARLMTAVSLEGPPTATYGGSAFRGRVTPLLTALGPLPHARLTANAILRGRAPDSCRQLKVACPSCGYLARVTKKWLEVGLPICPTDKIELVADEP